MKGPHFAIMQNNIKIEPQFTDDKTDKSFMAVPQSLNKSKFEICFRLK